MYSNCYSRYIVIESAIKIDPPFANTKMGTNMEFKCKSRYDVKWLFEGGALPSNTQVSRTRNVHMLKIIDVDQSNVGKYSCEGEDEGFTYYQSHAELSLYGKYYLIDGNIRSKHRLVHEFS